MPYKAVIINGILPYKAVKTMFRFWDAGAFTDDLNVFKGFKGLL
jgi:hypothetical protein